MDVWPIDSNQFNSCQYISLKTQIVKLMVLLEEKLPDHLHEFMIHSLRLKPVQLFNTGYVLKLRELDFWPVTLLKDSATKLGNNPGFIL